MNAQVVMDTLKAINVEDGRMVIANLHTLDTARRYCDRVIGMRDGRVVFDGTLTSCRPVSPATSTALMRVSTRPPPRPRSRPIPARIAPMPTS